MSPHRCEFPRCQDITASRHHIIPRNFSGDDKRENLVWLCHEHHNLAEGICTKCKNITTKYCRRPYFLECFGFDDSLPPIHFELDIASDQHENSSEKFNCPICGIRDITRKSVWQINIYAQKYSALYTCQNEHFFILIMNKTQWKEAIDSIKVELKSVPIPTDYVPSIDLNASNTSTSFVPVDLSQEKKAVEEETESNQLFQECPRFNKCNVNNCPLHPDYPELYTDQEDKQLKCTLEKQVRFKIGSKYPGVLKFQGLTSKEWAGKKRFESLSEVERQIIRDKAKRLISLASGKHLPQEGIDVLPAFPKQESIPQNNKALVPLLAVLAFLAFLFIVLLIIYFLASNPLISVVVIILMLYLLIKMLGRK